MKRSETPVRSRCKKATINLFSQAAISFLNVLQEDNTPGKKDSKYYFGAIILIFLKREIQ